jgi:signal transduction histidine kinase
LLTVEVKAAPAIHRLREHFHPLASVWKARFFPARKVKIETRIEPPAAQTMAAFRSIAKWEAIVAMVVGYHVLVGWLFDIQVLKSPGPTFSSMTLNEALCAVLAGFALFRLQKCPTEPSQKRIGVWICGALIALIGALSLLEDITGRNLGTTAWSAPLLRAVSAKASLPGPMAAMSSLDFLIIGLCLILVDRPHAIRSVEGLALISAAVSLLAIAGYLYNAKGFDGQMPLYGAIVLFLLSTGILFARPARGIMAKISSNSFGGIMARRLLPATLLIPLLLGFLQYRGLHAGLYGPEPGLAVFAVANVLLFLSVIWWGVNSLHGMDIKRRKAEHDLQEMAGKLARSNADLEQFAYVASHDLKEPLRAISGSVQILQERYGAELSPGADEVIKHTVDGAIRMQTLIDDLLAYSRLTTREAVVEPTDLKETVQEVLTNLEHSIKESKAVVTHDPLPTVQADGTQLLQVFQNLISNAIKYRSHRTPKIHIGVDDKGTEWLFCVRDNGIGIAPQYADRIFRIFQRLHTRKEYSGTGIGLAICKKIIERHRGRIWVESEPEEGSRFNFTLPKSLTMSVLE